MQTIAKTVNIDIADFFENGIIRESSFRQKVEQYDWDAFQDAKVVIRGCDDVPVPTWAYLAIAANLAPRASRIFWGEPCSAVLIYKRAPAA